MSGSHETLREDRHGHEFRRTMGSYVTEWSVKSLSEEYKKVTKTGRSNDERLPP